MTRWLGTVVAVVVVVGWLALGVAPYTATKTVVMGTETLRPVPPPPTSSALHVGCHGLFRHEPTNVTFNTFQFTSNPCLDGRATKQVVWAVGLVGLLALLAWALLGTRARRHSEPSRSPLEAQAAEPESPVTP